MKEIEQVFNTNSMDKSRNNVYINILPVALSEEVQGRKGCPETKNTNYKILRCL